MIPHFKICFIISLIGVVCSAKTLEAFGLGTGTEPQNTNMFRHRNLVKKFSSTHCERHRLNTSHGYRTTSNCIGERSGTLFYKKFSAEDNINELELQALPKSLVALENFHTESSIIELELPSLEDLPRSAMERQVQARLCTPLGLAELYLGRVAMVAAVLLFLTEILTGRSLPIQIADSLFPVS
jgi:hypothetical protein